ncbi:hypothetical protein TNCV_3825801 [Trichonephila clavipes]|nr:hypothetical protein TNCV_3825801 [Trichonephila clavipes]
MSGYRELYKELVPSQSLITDYLVKEKKITEVPEEALPCRSDDVILSSSDESDLAPIHKRPDGHGYELVSSVRALVRQKFSVEEELMHVKHVEVKSLHVGVMWKFGRGVISSGFSSPNLVDVDDTLTEFNAEPSLWEALPEQDLTFKDFVLVDMDIVVWGALSDAEIVAVDHNNTESDEDE